MKIVKNEFWDTPLKNRIKKGTKHFFVKMKKIKVVQNCLKWRENWSKLFSPPTKKNLGGVQKNVVKNEKNYSSSKLTEMARKLVEMIFGFLKNNSSLDFMTPLCIKKNP